MPPCAISNSETRCRVTQAPPSSQAPWQDRQLLDIDVHIIGIMRHIPRMTVELTRTLAIVDDKVLMVSVSLAHDFVRAFDMPRVLWVVVRDAHPRSSLLCGVDQLRQHFGHALSRHGHRNDRSPVFLRRSSQGYFPSCTLGRRATQATREELLSRSKSLPPMSGELDRRP